MTLTVRIGRLLPESVKVYMARVATPRVVERERQLLDRVPHELGVFIACVEGEIRVADTRLDGVLDSDDVRSAITDLRDRVGNLTASLRNDVVGVESLLEFIATARDLGVGGIKAATTPDEVADAASRAVDHLEGYMLARGHVVYRAEARSLAVFFEPDNVRKHHAAVTVASVAAWQKPGELVELGRDRAGHASLA